MIANAIGTMRGGDVSWQLGRKLGLGILNTGSELTLVAVPRWRAAAG